MKKVDERKITAIGYYYCASLPTFLKKTQSCVEAGYNESYAQSNYANILGLDSFIGTDHPVWGKLTEDLVFTEEMYRNWLVKHKDNPGTKHIRELPKYIRLIGDSVGKFIKREEKITHNIDEKRAVVIYATSEEHRKAIQEKITVLSSQLEQIDVERKESG